MKFDSRLENAVSNALRHPLDPEVMREPEQEEKALWSVAARFAAAIGVAAVVALFFVIVVPVARQSDGEPPLGDRAIDQGRAVPARRDFAEARHQRVPGDSRLHSAQRAAADPSGELLQQFMQWREKPDPATPQRTNP